MEIDTMTPRRIVELLNNLILDACERAEETKDEPADDLVHTIVEAVDFKDAGVACGVDNSGFVLRMDDGSEFHVLVAKFK
jgi:hypothetical protein